MKTLLLLALAAFSFSSYSQDSTFKKSISNHIDTILPFSSNDSRFLRSAAFDNGTMQVQAHTTQVNGGPSNAIYWTRNNQGTTTKGAFSVPVADHCDLVIGDGGNKILYAHRGPGDIGFKVYEFSGANYTLDTSGFIADVIFNPPAKVMQYAGPNLCIDQNDNVVVFYRSIDGVAPGSDTIHHFARAGDIDGNWIDYPNHFNAYVVDQGLSFPAKYSTDRGDVGITKYATNNMVNFSFTVSGLNNTNYIYHAQVSFNDLAAGIYTNLQHQVLASSTTDQFLYPSVDGGNMASGTPIADDWAVAYDQIHGRNDIKLAKGNGGGFLTSPFLSTMLKLDRQFGPPELHFSNGTAGVCFSSNDTTYCKNDWDPFYVKLNNALSINSLEDLIRINTDEYLNGSQRAVSLASGIGNSAPYLIYFNQPSKEIVSANLVEAIPCNSFVSLPEDNLEKIEAPIVKTEYYSLQGKLIKQCYLPSTADLPQHTILLEVKYFADGNIQTSKIKIQPGK